jgi:hypothetical protein
MVWIRGEDEGEQGECRNAALAGIIPATPQPSARTRQRFGWLLYARGF